MAGDNLSFDSKQNTVRADDSLPTSQWNSLEFLAAPIKESYGNTTVRRDGSGKISEYDNGDFTVARHDDGKWWYHQNGDGHKYVEVDGNSIKMDEQGKVTYNEKGLLHKNKQTLGRSHGGLLDSVKVTVSDAMKSAAEDPLDLANDIAFMPIAALDAATGTRVIKAFETIEKGAVDEVIHHPGEVLKDAAIGAAIAGLTVATGGGALAALAIGGAYFAADELIKNKGNISGVTGDIKGMAQTIVNWGKDFGTVASSKPQSERNLAEAEQGLRQLGAFGAETLAGIAGGMAGDAAASAMGLGDFAPTTVKGSGDTNLYDAISNGSADASLNEDTALLKSRHLEGQHYLVLSKDGKVTGIEAPALYGDNSPNYFKQAYDPDFLKAARELNVSKTAKILELEQGLSPSQAQDYAKFIEQHYRPQPAVTVNSASERTEQLLHMHLDNLDPKVYGELAEIAGKNGFSTESFQDIGTLIPGKAEHLKARWIPSAADGGLGDANPFKMVRDSLPANLKQTMGEHSIAVVPMEYKNASGFLIIDGQAQYGGGALEWLQRLGSWSKVD
jgi:CDP-diacylglycerol pyrophosphatase